MVFWRAAFPPVFSSGHIKTLEEWGKNPELKIRREGIRIKSRNRYNENKRKYPLRGKKKPLHLKEVCKKHLEPDIHALVLCFR